LSDGVSTVSSSLEYWYLAGLYWEGVSCIDRSMRDVRSRNGPSGACPCPVPLLLHVRRPRMHGSSRTHRSLAGASWKENRAGGHAVCDSIGGLHLHRHRHADVHYAQSGVLINWIVTHVSVNSLNRELDRNFADRVILHAYVFRSAKLTRAVVRTSFSPR
jgi:hypothetical protein